jgi:hypothetical protein
MCFPGSTEFTIKDIEEDIRRISPVGRDYMCFLILVIP